MSDPKPNILLITTDQQRFDTIQALGNDRIYTPHLNWLVDEGLTFERCYADAPICMPSRATIMTGKCGYTTGLVGNSDRVRPMAENPTLPGLLTADGYQTRAQGKMHFAPMRANYGFEHMELPMDYYRACNRNQDAALPKAHGVGENEVEPVISTVHETQSLTHWTVQRSIDFLETRDETRPFFLWTSFTKPHPPLDPCANYWALYQNMDMPDPVRGDWSVSAPEVPQGFLQPTYHLNNMYRLGEEQRRNVRRAYYATITQIDYSLGLLFARMRELGLLENTWIVFTSDHGDMLGDHWMGAKSVFLEGASHVPLIVRPPQSSWEMHELGGTRHAGPVTLADIMPTLLNIAGVAPPDDVDGRDLLRQASAEEHDRVLFGSSCGDFFSVTERRYKYQWCRMGGSELLFDIENDPREEHELIRAGAHTEVHRRMRASLLEFLGRHHPELVQDGEPVADSAPSGPAAVGRWPGYHSTVVASDVLH